MAAVPEPDQPREPAEIAATQELPSPPRLPERAAIYIAKNGTVHFGALFEGLLPVARALAGEKSAHE